LTIRNARQGAEERPEILLYGDVGIDWDGFSAEQCAQALNSIGRVPAIGVRVNSMGGDVAQGFAIYNLLRSNGAKIIVNVDGMALSSAATICMAGDQILMAQNASMMIHKPATFCYGEAPELRKQADVLDLLQQQIAGVYAARSGKSVDEINVLLDAETWLTAEEAKEMNLATEVIPNKGADAGAENRIPAGRFKNAPQRLLAAPGEGDARAPWRRNLARRRLDLLQRAH